MRPQNSTSGRRSGSFLEAARRAQIIEAAIATVNQLGFARSSLAQIARRAGTSKSVISYHFDDKEELLEQVVAHVFHEAGERIVAAVDREATWSAKLAAYIRAELAFVRDSRERMTAATEILISHRSPDGVPMYLQGAEEETELLESILRGGQSADDFGSFDVNVAALTILHAVDGALTQSQKDASTDLDAYANHLVRLVLRMVGSDEAS
jgi:AcrR family transcriptional regulator